MANTFELVPEHVPPVEPAWGSSRHVWLKHALDPTGALVLKLSVAYISMDTGTCGVKP
jgi:hypothetical protein